MGHLSLKEDSIQPALEIFSRVHPQTFLICYNLLYNRLKDYLWPCGI